MPIYNKITPERVSEINACLQSYEQDFYRRDDAKTYPDKDYWEVLDAGMARIEASPTRHLMFADADEQGE